MIFWLHKGADGFMSEADYRTFYWPTLKAVIMGLIEQGLVPALFAQGSYLKRLDIVSRRRVSRPAVSSGCSTRPTWAPPSGPLGGRACIAGNVPTGLLALASAGEVEQYVTGLLNECATDGGFILRERSRAGRRQGGQPQSDAGDGAELARVGAERPA